MASVISAPARVDEAEGVPLLRAGKRPRPGVAASANTMQGRPFFDEHKWALLEREQELERRRAEEVSRGSRLTKRSGCPMGKKLRGCSRYTVWFFVCLMAMGKKSV